MEKLTEKQIKIASIIQKDIEITKYPFRVAVGSSDCTENDFLQTINYFIKKGFLRRFGALIRHQKAGYQTNALILWSVPENKIETTGEIFASFPFVSHCYERKPAFEKKYNLFSMIHSLDANIPSLTKEMSGITGITDYMILESIEEFKKASPEYF